MAKRILATMLAVLIFSELMLAESTNRKADNTEDEKTARTHYFWLLTMLLRQRLCSRPSL